MNYQETGFAGLYLIAMETQEDARGSFARSFCQKEFKEKGLSPRIAQCNVSFNRKKGTLRGLHYQDEPHPEEKLVRCTRGGIYDVAVDLRRDSRTYKKWYAIELTEGNGLMLYIPAGFAHGFQTLADDTEVYYQMSEFYYPECARGLRWDDPAFAIQWPKVNERIISDKDRGYKDFSA